MSKSGTNSLKNKTWEEIYGITKANKLKIYKRKMFKGKSLIDRYGKKKAALIIKKIQKAAKGRPLTISQRKAIIKSNKTRKITKKTLLKMSKSHTGHYWSPIAREKNRLSHLGERNHFFGKKHTKKTIKKIRDSRQFIKMPNKNTKPEQKLHNILKSNNIIFSKHAKLIGRPDIFIEPNICIFCDGDYWHANPNKYKSTDIISKRHNMMAKDIWKKDKKITNTLIKKGYKVLRFWENDIYNNLDISIIINKIKGVIK